MKGVESDDWKVYDLLRDKRTSTLNYKRLVVLKSLHSKNKYSSTGLSLQEIKGILFDLSTSSHVGYFKTKDVGPKKVNQLSLESLIQKNNDKFLLNS